MKTSTRGLPAALLGVALALAVGLVPWTTKTARADATPTYTITATDPDETVPLSESAALPYDVTLQTIAQEYPLWVGGTQVTEENMGDVLKGTANEGKVSFSPAKDGTPATLTLKGANITTGHVFNDVENVSHSYSIYYTGTDPLTIVVASDSTVDVSGEEADVVAGIFCEYSGLAITGEGKLTATSVAEGISGLGDVTIDKGVVDATGVNSGIIAREGDVVITNDSTVEADGGINGKRVTISSGTVKASGEWSGIFGDSVTIRGGEVTATASNGNGISANSTNDGPGTVTISGGIVSATGGANGSGIYTQKYGAREPPGNVTIDGDIASVTASGGKQAIEGIVTNAVVAGMGWTDEAGTADKAVIAISADGQDLSAYKKVQFPTPVAKVTTAPEATNPTHNGKAQELVTAGTAEGGAMRYSLDGETWSDKVPTGTDAKSYTVWYKAVGDDQHADSEPQEATSSIAKADPTVTAPKATNPTYNGEAQALVEAGTAKGGEMRYSLDGEAWSDKVPTGTDAKSYAVWYKVIGDENHNDSEPQKAIAKIAKAAPKATAPKARSLTYNGEAQALVEAGTAKGGAMRYSLDGEAWSDKVPTGTDAKSYTVWYKVVGDENHYDSEPQKVIAKIAKAAPKVTAPKARSLTYNGKAQALVEAGTAEGGTMQYSLDGKSFSEKVPTATEAKSYTVWYKVAGDANHTDSAPQSITSTIAKKDEPAPTPTPTPTPTVAVAKASKPTTVAYPSKGKVAVSWKAAKGAKAYQLQWRKAGAKKWAAVSVKGKSKAVTGLKAGVAYEFRVRGVSGKVSGKWSAASPCWLKGVSKVKASSGKAKGTIKVTWKADKSATGGFKVFVYAKKGGKLVATKKVSKSKASVTIKGLKSGKTYYVRVRPYRVKSGTTYTGAISGWKSAKAK